MFFVCVSVCLFVFGWLAGWLFVRSFACLSACLLSSSLNFHQFDPDQMARTLLIQLCSAVCKKESKKVCSFVSTIVQCRSFNFCRFHMFVRDVVLCRFVFV